jgi:hypothetical protein
MTREIVLDTETTSTDAKVDRIIEVGCVELVNHIQTGQTFHRYIKPQRAVHPDAFAVHGLSDGFLADKPLFAEIVPELLAFIGDAVRSSFTMRRSTSASPTPSSRACPRRSRRRSNSTPSSTRCSWRAASTQARPTTSTRCARATASIGVAARSTGRCWTRRSSQRSMWSCSAASRSASIWVPPRLCRLRPSPKLLGREGRACPSFG